MSNNTQPSGAGFIIVDKILGDLTDRRGLRHAWEGIDGDIQAEIKHEWAMLATEVLDMQALVIKHQAKDTPPSVTQETLDKVREYVEYAHKTLQEYRNIDSYYGGHMDLGEQILTLLPRKDGGV